MIHLEDVLKSSWRLPENVLKISWRHLCKTSLKNFEDVFKTSSRRLADFFKISSRRLTKTNLFVLSWRRLEGAFWRYMTNILVSIKTSWRHVEDVFSRGRQKTSSLRWIFAKTIQEMCNKTVDTWPIVLDSVPDWYMW